VSITIWNRIEPRTREGKKVRAPDDPTPDPLRRALQAQVRDPAFFLARQWQLGEFLGEDAGSPIEAAIRVETHPLTSVTIGGAVSAVASNDVPVEIRVERTQVELGLRGSVQLGLRFEELLRGLGLTNAELDASLDDFRTAYAIALATPVDEITSAAAVGLRRIAATRVTDGVKLFDDASGTLPSVAPGLQALLSAAEWQQVLPAVQQFVDYRRSLYTEPGGAPSAWDPQHLHHTFSLEVGGLGLALEAPEYGGGHLDWYDVRSVQRNAAAAPNPLVFERTFVPQPIGFRGMASSRWWTLDDRRTDFGSVDAQHTDLARMLLAEFALIYSEDWYELPVRLPIGTVSRVTLLVVTNTFGERTLIRPTHEQVSGNQQPWSLFALSGASPPGALFLAPALDAVLEGNTLEEVNFFRDEVAAMGWAVERTLAGTMDSPVDGYETYLDRVRRTPPSPALPVVAGGPEVEYVLGTTVPDNWIPLVPVAGAPRSFLFRRGLMQRPRPGGGFDDVPARGQILEPERRPFYVAEEALPRSGARVSRRFRRARWIDGRTHTWIGRQSGVGRGEGASGLAFDSVRPIRQP